MIFFENRLLAKTPNILGSFLLTLKKWSIPRPNEASSGIGRPTKRKRASHKFSFSCKTSHESFLLGLSFFAYQTSIMGFLSASFSVNFIAFLALLSNRSLFCSHFWRCSSSSCSSPDVEDILLQICCNETISKPTSLEAKQLCSTPRHAKWPNFNDAKSMNHNRWTTKATQDLTSAMSNNIKMAMQTAKKKLTHSYLRLMQLIVRLLDELRGNRRQTENGHDKDFRDLHENHSQIKKGVQNSSNSKEVQNLQTLSCSILLLSIQVFWSTLKQAKPQQYCLISFVIVCPQKINFYVLSLCFLISVLWDGEEIILSKMSHKERQKWGHTNPVFWC